jgi:hypothetical protein
MLYFDTSFLTPLVREEATSVPVERFVSSLSDDLAISHWTRVEFAPLLALHIRMGGSTADSPRKLAVGFDAMVEESLVILLPDVDDFDLARRPASGDCR